MVLRHKKEEPSMKMKLSPTMGQGGQKAMTGSIQEMMVCLEDAVVTEEQSERTQKQAEAINNRGTAASGQGRLMRDSYSGTQCKSLRVVHRALRQKIKSYSRRQGGLSGLSRLDV